MSMSQAIADIFRECLVLPTELDLKTVGYRKTKSWDSLAHMQLIGALESRFDIMLDTQDVLELSDFPRAVEIISKYQADA